MEKEKKGKEINFYEIRGKEDMLVVEENPEIFTGREEKLRWYYEEIKKYVDGLPKYGIGIISQRKLGKTAIVKRLLNTIYKKGEGKVIGLYYEYGERDLIEESKRMVREFIKQGMIQKERNTRWNEIGEEEEITEENASEVAKEEENVRKALELKEKYYKKIEEIEESYRTSIKNILRDELKSLEEKMEELKKKKKELKEEKERLEEKKRELKEEKKEKEEEMIEEEEEMKEKFREIEELKKKKEKMDKECYEGYMELNKISIERIKDNIERRKREIKRLEEEEKKLEQEMKEIKEEEIEVESKINNDEEEIKEIKKIIECIEKRREEEIEVKGKIAMREIKRKGDEMIRSIMKKILKDLRWEIKKEIGTMRKVVLVLDEIQNIFMGIKYMGVKVDGRDIILRMMIPNGAWVIILGSKSGKVKEEILWRHREKKLIYKVIEELEEEEARELIRKIIEKEGYEIYEGMEEDVFNLTMRHPYYITKLLISKGERKKSFRSREELYMEMKKEMLESTGEVYQYVNSQVKENVKSINGGKSGLGYYILKIVGEKIEKMIEKKERIRDIRAMEIEEDIRREMKKKAKKLRMREEEIGVIELGLENEEDYKEEELIKKIKKKCEEMQENELLRYDNAKIKTTLDYIRPVIGLYAYYKITGGKDEEKIRRIIERLIRLQVENKELKEKNKGLSEEIENERKENEKLKEVVEEYNRKKKREKGRESNRIGREIEEEMRKKINERGKIEIGGNYYKITREIENVTMRYGGKDVQIDGYGKIRDKKGKEYIILIESKYRRNRIGKNIKKIIEDMKIKEIVVKENKRRYEKRIKKVLIVKEGGLLEEARNKLREEGIEVKTYKEVGVYLELIIKEERKKKEKREKEREIKKIIRKIEKIKGKNIKKKMEKRNKIYCELEEGKRKKELILIVRKGKIYKGEAKKIIEGIKKEKKNNKEVILVILSKISKTAYNLLKQNKIEIIIN